MDRHAWDDRYRQKPWMWSAEPNRFLVEEVGHLAPGRALDLACGEGRNAVWLARQGWQVVAVDFSEVAIERGRELAARHDVEVTFLLADVADYRPDPAAFDLVVILYLQLPRDSLHSIHRAAAAALAPGGRLLVVGHDVANLSEGWGGPQDPAVLLTVEQVVEDLAGLEIERAEQVRRPVETPDGSATAVDTLVRGRRQPHRRRQPKR